jgi:hypothetical protein
MIEPEAEPEQEAPPNHYHGNEVRTLFIVGAVIMILDLAYAVNHLETTFAVSFAAIIVIGYAAGITTEKVWSAVLNAGVATVALPFFETYAVREYNLNGMSSFFWVNEALAVIFLVALYLSIRTLRWMLQAK